MVGDWRVHVPCPRRVCNHACIQNTHTQTHTHTNTHTPTHHICTAWYSSRSPVCCYGCLSGAGGLFHLFVIYTLLVLFVCLFVYLFIYSCIYGDTHCFQLLPGVFNLLL